MKFSVLLAVLAVMTSCKGVSQEKDMAKDEGQEKTKEFKVQKTEAEWKAELTDAEF